MKTTVLHAPARWRVRSARRRRSAPAPLRPRTTASWARETRESSAAAAGAAVRAGGREVVRAVDRGPAAASRSAETPGRLIPYLGAAAVVFALALNVRPLLAAFVCAVELLK